MRAAGYLFGGLALIFASAIGGSFLAEHLWRAAWHVPALAVGALTFFLVAIGFASMSVGADEAKKGGRP